MYQIQPREIDALIPYARNARTHSDEQVALIMGSLVEFGWTNPVLIGADGIVIAGHGRLMAARRLRDCGSVAIPEWPDRDTVPTVELSHLTEAQRRAYVLADNQLSARAGWDEDMLALELGDLQAVGFDLDILGFEDDLLASLDFGDEPSVGLTDPDEVPEPPATPVTNTGDIWVMGPHRLMCGDSTSQADVEALCQSALVDMWLTDPPYNVAYEGGTKDKLKIKNDDMGDEQFRQFLADAYRAADSVMKPGAVFYIWHADTEGFNFRGAARDSGWQVRQCLIWKKQSLVLGRQDYHWQHEPCLYGWKAGAGHLWASDRKQTTILEFDKPIRNGEHPTMKPVALFEYQMLNNTKGGDVVLDSFGGSGTTLIAAEQNGRHARIMELDPRYCDVIVKRWQAFTGKQAVLESTGQSFGE